VFQGLPGGSRAASREDGAELGLIRPGGGQLERFAGFTAIA